MQTATPVRSLHAGLVLAPKIPTGELEEEGVVELFQHLINTGMAWSLQGHYGRVAFDLIKAGECRLP